VTGIDPAANRIEIGTKDKLLHTGCIARSANMVKYADCLTPISVDAKIRYRDSGGPARAVQTEDGRLRVEFLERRRAITPGQSVVVYEGDDLVGGGIIDRVLG
jgi:tRNA-specific 2-thiouridylase